MLTAPKTAWSRCRRWRMIPLMYEMITLYGVASICSSTSGLVAVFPISQ